MVDGPLRLFCASTLRLGEVLLILRRRTGTAAAVRGLFDWMVNVYATGIQEWKVGMWSHNKSQDTSRTRTPQHPQTIDLYIKLACLAGLAVSLLPNSSAGGDR